MDENKVVEVPVVENKVEEPDPIALKDAEIARLKTERDNYKKVSLKRLGKLPNDAEFLSDEAKESGLTTEETVKQILIDREISRVEQDKDIEIKRIQKENAELRLSLKNRPGSSIGSGSGGSSDVKDNVFSEAQLADLRARALRLKADPEKFIANAKNNLQRK